MDVTLSKALTHNSDISFILVFGFRFGGSRTCDLYVCTIIIIILVVIQAIFSCQNILQVSSDGYISMVKCIVGRLPQIPGQGFDRVVIDTRISGTVRYTGFIGHNPNISGVCSFIKDKTGVSLPTIPSNKVISPVSMIVVEWNCVSG